MNNKTSTSPEWGRYWMKFIKDKALNTGVERFWRNLIAGSAACRFHRLDSGIGLNDTAKACIRAARKVESLVKFWNIEPDMGFLRNNEKDEAYLAAGAGEQHVLYFTDNGSVELYLKANADTFILRWVNIQTGAWEGKISISNKKAVLITAPGRAGRAAVITKAHE